ncbi:MAG: prolyl oligopeptidase family serine peptidase, partial [Thermoanaerobaculia bacterium]
EFHGDPRRVILTGLSIGGYGAYALAYEHPDRFAALVPICGGILGHSSASTVVQLPATAGSTDPYALVAARIREIPTWIFHGADDPVIPVEEARHMDAALKAAGADVRYTELPGTGHNAWDPAYGNADLWKWLLNQRR